MGSLQIYRALPLLAWLWVRRGRLTRQPGQRYPGVGKCLLRAWAFPHAAPLRDSAMPRRGGIPLTTGGPFCMPPPSGREGISLHCSPPAPCVHQPLRHPPPVLPVEHGCCIGKKLHGPGRPRLCISSGWRGSSGVPAKKRPHEPSSPCGVLSCTTSAPLVSTPAPRQPSALASEHRHGAQVHRKSTPPLGPGWHVSLEANQKPGTARGICIDIACRRMRSSSCGACM